ncbi:pilus assembly protein PilM, partial [bacterium]|nr:pilus assembly protein PilM [bacterium]
MAQTKKKKSITNLLSGGEKTVALDIGSRYVKLAILQRKKNGVAAKQLDQMAIPFTSSRGDVTPEAVKDTVKQLLQRNKIKDTGVLSVMSRDFVTVSHLELPSTDREQIKQMLVFEAESHLPFAMERAITAFDFKPIEQPKAEPKEGEEAPAEPASVMSKVVFAAVRQALIPKFLELHSQKGLKQTAIQVSSFTIFNLYDFLKREGKIPETEGDTLIIEMGARRTEFILVNAKGELVFTRNVEKGGDDLTMFLAGEEGISFEEAEQRKIKNWEETKLNDPLELLRAMEGVNSELDKTIRFLKNRGLSENITQVCVSGGGAARPEVCRALSAPLGIDAPLYLNGLEAIEAKGKDLFGPSFSAVLGAALAQVDEAAIYIDLLPVDVVKLQLLAMRRKMLIKLAIGVAAV